MHRQNRDGSDPRNGSVERPLPPIPERSDSKPEEEEEKSGDEVSAKVINSFKLHHLNEHKNL